MLPESLATRSKVTEVPFCRRDPQKSAQLLFDNKGFMKDVTSAGPVAADGLGGIPAAKVGTDWDEAMPSNLRKGRMLSSLLQHVSDSIRDNKAVKVCINVQTSESSGPRKPLKSFRCVMTRKEVLGIKRRIVKDYRDAEGKVLAMCMAGHARSILCACV